jgi:Uma2 family endonuclease
MWIEASEMSAALKWNLVTVEDYLAGELISPIKHEYVAGVVHVMAGARVSHNDISSNTLGSLYMRLRGKRCKAYGSDMKIRVQIGEKTRFYYPDASVVCKSNPPNDSFQDQPVAIFEVLSKGTRRTDTGEKKDAYLTIPSLHVYGLIEQESALVVVYRRKGDGFESEVYEGVGAMVPLPEVDIELPLAEIYENIEFVPEPDGDEYR